MYILRKLITLTIIFSLAFFEVGQSIQMNSAFSQTGIGVSTTVGSEGKALEMESEGMFAANRWVNTVALLMVGTISLLAAKMCFDNNKKKTGINCAPSTISLGVAGTALLAGYIWSWVKFQDRSFSKIHVSGLNNDGTLTENSKLAQYANLCKKIQEDGYDLGGKSPEEIQQDAEAKKWPIPGGATGESITLYCDQYGSLKVQKNVLQNMLDGLFAEVIFLAAAEAALLTAFGFELSEALAYWARQELHEKTFQMFYTKLVAYHKAYHAFSKGISSQIKVTDVEVAMAPCHVAIVTCEDSMDAYASHKEYYNSQIFELVILDGSDKVPLCGTRAESKIKSYRDTINFCTHAVWTCEKSLAQISILEASRTIAASGCTKSGGTLAKPRRGFVCARKQMTPAQITAQNARIDADNEQRRIVRKAHLARGRTNKATKATMTPQEWAARIAIRNINADGTGRKMGSKQTDMNTWISLLPKLQHCEITGVVRTCEEEAKEATVEIPALALAKKKLHPFQKTLQKLLPKLMEGTKEAKCSLDDFRSKRLETYDTTVQAAIQKLKFGVGPENAMATAATAPAQQEDTRREEADDSANTASKARGTGCMIACSDPTRTSLPNGPGASLENNDDQLWNDLLESVINSAYAKKNEESTIGTQTAVSGVIGIVGIGGAAFGILFQKTGTFQKLFHKTPGTRMGWIGGMAALVFAAIATNREAASQVKDDISKLDTIISEATGGEGGGSLPTGDDPPDEEDPKDPDPDPEEGPDIAETSAEDSSSTNTGRPGGGGFSGVFGGGSNFNIKDLAIAPPNKKIFIGATSASKNSGASAASASKPVPGMQEVQDFGNEVQRGELRGQQNIKALAARAKKLSSKKNLIQKFVDKAKNKLNAVLKRSGQKPIDFKKRGQIALASIMTPIKNSKNPKIQAALKGNNLLASLPKNLSSGNESSFKLPQMNDYGSSSDYSSGQSFGGDSFDDDLPKTADEIQANEEIKELDIKMDSINKRSDVSIFKVITRRYLRSAYPVFFKSK